MKTHFTFKNKKNNYHDVTHIKMTFHNNGKPAKLKVHDKF